MQEKQPSEDDIKKVMSYIGKKGGASKSEAKQAASRMNGKKGGRPKGSGKKGE